MAKVNFTYALKRFFPDLKELEIDAGDVRALVSGLETQYPGIRNYIVDDQGRLREHVNIFLNGDLIRDKISLSDEVAPGDEVYIMQALSGGL